MSWPPPPDDYPFDDPYRHRQQSRDDRLRHVVFLDGLLIDSWVQPVEGTAYWEQAQEVDRDLERIARRRKHLLEPPPTPPHEVVLEWLDSVVGGRAALLGMDDEPLPQVQASEDAQAAEAEELIARLCRDYFDGEFLLACRAALTALSGIGQDVLSGSPAEVASAVVWMVGRANGCVGAGTEVTQQLLRRELWVKNGISARANRFRQRLRDLLPTGRCRPASCPDLLELGSTDYLTSATRRELIGLRDRALAVAGAAEADLQARTATAVQTEPPR